MRLVFVFLAIVLSLGLVKTAKAEEADLKNKLNHFRLAPMMLYKNNQSSYSIIGSWNPKFYRIGRSVFGANLGASVFEDQDNKKFPLFEYTATWKYLLTQRWKAELGLGFQTISADDVGTNFVISGSGHYSLQKNRFNIDEIFAGYTNLSYKKDVIHQIRIGIGFHF